MTTTIATDLGKTLGMPKRIQCKRTKGWRMPANVVYVGRPGVYSNPFPNAIEFRDWWGNRGNPKHWTFGRYPHRMDMLMGAMFNGPQPLIHGKNVACWCALCDDHKDGLPLGVKCALCADCHGDLVLEIANA